MQHHLQHHPPATPIEILSPIWHVKAATAREVRQRIRAVLDWAIALDMRSDNPCDRVLPVLGPQNDIVTHRLALPHKDVAAAIETVRTSKSGQAAEAGVRVSRADGRPVGGGQACDVAHVVQNKVEAAYARSDLFKRRRLLMDDWARYLTRDGPYL